MKRAFTLIELLVVIAIIAILAAILFPVFAQAKVAAKKTATMSQYKQVGTGAQIYISDYDDVYPLAFGPNSSTGGWRIGSYHAVPNGWSSTGGRDLEPRKSEEGMMVSNSLYPYIKNWGLYEGTGLPTASNPALAQSALAGAPRPALANLSFNGMLHAWSATAVAQPSRLPLLSPTMMRQNLKGAIITSPALDCQSSANQNCRFAPDALPSGAPGPFGGSGYGYVWWGVGDAANFSLWQYGRGMAFVASDTSARFMNFNAPNWPQYAANVNSSPWSAFDPNGPPGSPYWMTDCVSPGVAKGGGRVFYPGYYRPDSEYNYTSLECDFGGG
jgi:prepilin-type N-terminal cleavage/methylation domain-containing protein